MTQAKKLGKKIKEIRKSLGLNQSEFARKINATVPAVSNWENGRNMPNDGRLKSIADIAGMNVLELLQNETNRDALPAKHKNPEQLKHKIIKLKNIVNTLESGFLTKNEVISATKEIIPELVEEYNSLFHDETI